MAIDELNHVIELDPKNLQAKILLGRVSMMPYRQPDGTIGISRASLERAEMNLEVAAQTAPNNLEAKRELALAYEKLGKKLEAVSTWTALRDLAAKSPANDKIAAEAIAAIDRLKYSIYLVGAAADLETGLSNHGSRIKRYFSVLLSSFLELQPLTHHGLCRLKYAVTLDEIAKDLRRARNP